MSLIFEYRPRIVADYLRQSGDTSNYFTGTPWWGVYPPYDLWNDAIQPYNPYPLTPNDYPYPIPYPWNKERIITTTDSIATISNTNTSDDDLKYKGRIVDASHPVTIRDTGDSIIITCIIAGSDSTSPFRVFVKSSDEIENLLTVGIYRHYVPSYGDYKVDKILNTSDTYTPPASVNCKCELPTVHEYDVSNISNSIENGLIHITIPYKVIPKIDIKFDIE